MKRYFTTLVSLVIAAVPTVARADLQGELNRMFGSLSNATPPGVWETQRRGVISGGSLTTRNKIMQENLVSFTPPRFEAGCGGIDLFGGSFSFVNADQFVQLLRSIAANASGYAFQIALDAMCPSCMQNLETLQKKVMEFNRHFANSCQLAQGIVNDSLSAFGKKGLTDASMMATLNGASDVFGSWTATDGRSPRQKAQSVNPAEVQQRLDGNLVWRALTKNGAGAWFAAGDQAFLEAAMSTTGTIVVSTAGGEEKVDDYPSTISIKDLVRGGQVAVWACGPTADENGCLALTKRVVDLRGLKQMVEETLLGSSTSPGLIAKYARNTGALTAEELAFLTSLPEGIGAMIRNLAIRNEGTAKTFVLEAGEYIALEMASVVVMDMSRAVELATALSDHAHAKRMMDKIRIARLDLQQEIAALRTKNGGKDAMLAYYNNLLQAVQKRQYAAARAAPNDPAL